MFGIAKHSDCFSKAEQCFPDGAGWRNDMDTYTGFASVYDMFMENIPYDTVAAYLCRRLEQYGITSGLLLELGCGTGEMTMRMAAAGYDMIGVDASEDMLAEAREKQTLDARAASILYLLQDMREFELYGTVAAVYAVTDSMNYITEQADFVQVLRLVNNYLDPGGIFIFDMKTRYFFEEILAERTFAEQREDAALIWENTFDEARAVNEYAVTIYKREEESGRYRREEEFHYQRAYCLAEIRRMLAEAGMQFVQAFAAYTEEPPRESECERIFIVARERGK